MKIVIESTDKIVSLDGVQCRLWFGETASGHRVHVWVHRVAAPTQRQVNRELEAELQEQLPPGQQVSLREVL